MSTISLTMYIVDYHDRIVTLSHYRIIVGDNILSDAWDSSFNTVLWGKLPFYSNIIGDLLFREEASIWERLFIKRSSDLLNPIDFFSNVCRTEYNFGLAKESGNDSSLREMLTNTIMYKPNYLDFIHIYHALAVEDNIRFEVFQKSFFYEIFFHLLKKEPVVCKPIFLAVCKKYMGLDICESLLDNVIRFYSNKYACMVIPRRHGKTFMTGSSIVALLLTTLKHSLRMGYYSHTKDLSQTVKNYVVSKCNEMSSKLTQSRYSIMTPSDSVLVKIINEQNTTFFSNNNIKKDDDFNCLAKFKSARNDNALRGDDLNVLVVDETFSINKNRFGTILAHGQKTDNKIIFLTSPVNHKVEMMSEITRGLKCRSDINFYHIYYFCNDVEHLQHASKQPACPRLIFYKPDHININETNRYLTNLLAQSQTSYDDELGIVSVSETFGKSEFTKLCPFSNRILTYLKFNVNTIDDSVYVNNVFIYLDPNYCDSLSSGIGLVASSLTKDETPCVLYLDHKFIQPEELGKANEIMVKMILHCISHVSSLVTNKRNREGTKKILNRKVFVAVENNSQRNSVAIIHEQLKKCFKDSDIQVCLYCTPTENRMTKQLSKRAGYTLLNKFTIFSQTIQYINEKLIWFSNQLYSYYLHLDRVNEIDYLTQNMQNFKFSPQEKKFSGKSSSSTDDLVVALIMSVYLARTYSVSADSSNWLSMTCWLPV